MLMDMKNAGTTGQEMYEGMKIQKRDGRIVPYEEEKIIDAIHKANQEVEEKDRADDALIKRYWRLSRQREKSSRQWSMCRM